MALGVSPILAAVLSRGQTLGMEVHKSTASILAQDLLDEETCTPMSGLSSAEDSIDEGYEYSREYQLALCSHNSHRSL